MEKWLGLLNRHIRSVKKPDEAADAYADIHMGFVWIHPFFDGNGRMARLLANLPVLKAGYPPILIPMRKRREYLLCLSRYSLEASPPPSGTRPSFRSTSRSHVSGNFAKNYGKTPSPW
ncbi:hypothetical protein EPICR_10372 [Candidatus Desulfarcum epimagneticum]|uniref:Fido domain-containing protein n=1 Tax=uncultured Desulfobacteraceae bacterium TaxID=218296 RepID=A0A484HDU6_9BACT|nr:hypothetical protein EPICR_10372 [uncultured Desulfobacteraceae bacterium]